MVVCPTCGQGYEQPGFCAVDGAQLVEPTDPLIGTEIGRFRIARLLGEGGMGQVYLGVQPSIGSRVAIKILSNECTRNPELIDRFFAEARAVNLVRHENIASVLDMEQLPDGRPYIVMEFIEGATLGSLIRAGGASLPLGGVVQVVSEVLSALGAAHAIGIIHRDLKPDNVIVTAEGHAKVLDFGIAKLAPGLSNALSPRTRTGALLGTPSYMAPEQISGAANVDPRTDIYAAGVLMFEACTGRVPFQGERLYDLMRAHLEQEPPSPRATRPDLPVAMEDAILTALAKDPDRRFQTAAAMIQALHHGSRELPAEQWRALSSRTSLVGRPSFERLMRPSQFGAAHAPTGGATPLPTTRKDAAPSPPPGRVGRRAPWLVLALGAVLAVGGVVGLVVARRSGSTPAHGAGTGSAVEFVVAAPTDPPAVVEVIEAVEPPTVVVRPETTETTEEVVVVEVEPGGGASAPATRTPGGGSAAAVAPRVTRPHDAGPTIVGGGSAADHGVHIGPGVQIGEGVVIGGGTRAPTPGANQQFTRAVDYNPKKFDGAAYARKALALARTLYPDAGFVRYDIYNVFPTGLANLGLTDDDSSYLFRSPSHSARPAGVPKNLDVEIPCYVEVTVGARSIDVRVRDYSLDGNCKDPLRPLPRCSHAQVWAKAKAAGADLDTVAKIAFLTDGKWFFDNDDSDGVGLVESYADRCP